MIKEVPRMVTQVGILKPSEAEPATMSLISECWRFEFFFQLQHAYLDEARERKNKSKRKEM